MLELLELLELSEVLALAEVLELAELPRSCRELPGAPRDKCFQDRGFDPGILGRHGLVLGRPPMLGINGK